MAPWQHWPCALAAWHVLLLLPLVLAPACHAAVHEYRDEPFYPSSDAYIFQGGREGLFAQTNTNPDEVVGVSNGKSYVKYNQLVFKRPVTQAELTTRVQAIVFEINDFDLIGWSSDDGLDRHYCCTAELAQKRLCKEGELILQAHSNPKWPWLREFEFPEMQETLPVHDDLMPINTTGMYYMWFVSCDMSQSITVSGKTVWKNPFGYLPGMLSPNLQFYGIMSLLYLLLGGFWLITYARHWKDILMLQNCITVVISLGMIEMATWYFDYVNFNKSGFRPKGTTIVAVLLGSLRKTLARMLLLVVSMGYGVVRPTLGGLKAKVVSLGVGYFVATCLYDVMLNVGTIDDLGSGTRVFLALPVAILDAVFILWIFTALSRTLAQLQSRRQTAKLDLYRKFTNTLAISVIISIFWIAYDMYFKVSDQYSERWQSEWIINAFWHMLTFGINCVICMLWAPSQNSTRYAYSDETPAEDWDEEMVEKQPLVAATIGENAPAAEKPQAKAAPSSEQSRSKQPVNTDVFAIDDADEESKLE
eukprot:jgi/Chlat1/7237/Chrsp58S00882